jgi:hypothetical protein
MTIHPPFQKSHRKYLEHHKFPDLPLRKKCLSFGLDSGTAHAALMKDCFMQETPYWSSLSRDTKSLFLFIQESYTLSFQPVYYILI